MTDHMNISVLKASTLMTEAMNIVVSEVKELLVPSSDPLVMLNIFTYTPPQYAGAA